MRHYPITQKGSTNQSHCKDHLIQQDEPSAPLGLAELANIGRRYGYFATKAKSLDTTENEQGPVTPGNNAGQRPNGKDNHGPDEGRYASFLFSNPPEEKGPQQLSNVTRGDQKTNVRERYFPERDDNGENVGDYDGIKGIEKGCNADDDTHLYVPGMERQPLNSRNDGLLSHRIINHGSSFRPSMLPLLMHATTNS